MSHSTRKEFLQTSAVVLAAIVTGSSFDFEKNKPLLSFSTLGCPDWTFEQITSFAVQHGYKGIEVRGLQRQIDLTKCPEFLTEESRKATMALMKEKELEFINLGSSATLHFAEGAEREKNLAEGKRFIDLAEQINCPYIRVYPNGFPKGQGRSATIGLIIKGLLELGDYAKGKNVSVLMETHGEVVKIADLEEIMQAAEHPNVGLVWDASNMWTVTKEPPAEAWKRLKKYIHHTHIKDAMLVDGKPQYKLLGQGEVPIFEAIDALSKGGYKGYYSFEWEKLWHPEIAEPEIALADYPKKMKQHFK
ncbi:MAG TPA: sugar phosphate isomerase/epimerase family protein [Chitinophagaceae bacterium]|nr:sugar phosphate isomerase/epimerase family protein [Chitinophagaceae bacterium]